MTISAALGEGARGVQSIEVGGRLLSVLAAQAGAMMLRDIAAAAGLAPAQAHAYLVSFRKIGLVERAPASTRYQLGPFALRLGLARMHVSDPIRLASEGIAALAGELEMLVCLTIWSGNGITVVGLQEAPFEIPANVQVGRTLPLLTTVAGRLFIAYAPAEEIRPQLRRELAVTDQASGGVMSLAELEAGAARARSRGYVALRDKPGPGFSGIALPIFGADGRIELAMTAIGLNATVDLTPESPQLAILRRFVDRISDRIGSRPPAPVSLDPYAS